MKKAKKASTVIIGRTLKEGYNHVIDYVVYPLVLLKLGYWTGLAIMIPVIAIENLIILSIYSRMKIDWLGYEYINQVKAWSENKRGVKRFVGTLIRKSDLFIFLLLSTTRDSFETTAYFMPEHGRNTRKTALIFIVSVLIGNLYWSLGVELFINSWLRKVLLF